MGKDTQNPARMRSLAERKVGLEVGKRGLEPGFLFWCGGFEHDRNSSLLLTASDHWPTSKVPLGPWEKEKGKRNRIKHTESGCGDLIDVGCKGDTYAVRVRGGRGRVGRAKPVRNDFHRAETDIFSFEIFWRKEKQRGGSLQSTPSERMGISIPLSLK